MKNLKTYEDYIKESYDFNANDVNESWKKNILLGLIGLLSFNSMASGANGNVKSTYDPETRVHHSEVVLDNPKSVDAYIKNGWSLQATDVDTLYQEIKVKAPETEVQSVSIKINKDNGFESGKFTITPETQDSLKSVMQYSLDNQLVLLKIDIKSSTDKQGLSDNLKSILTSMKLSPDNQGLSAARSGAVKQVLDRFGIDQSIINIINLKEQGDKEIDQNARYVQVDFIFAQKIVSKTSPEPQATTHTTYTLTKDNKASGTYKFSKDHSKITKLGKIENLAHSVKDIVCPSF
jgi:outer membrane protein OmpA-like peptidoglycan-associated protein